MLIEYYKERISALEREIESHRLAHETARVRGNKKLMGRSRKQMELAVTMREMYQRMLARERPEKVA